MAEVLTDSANPGTTEPRDPLAKDPAYHAGDPRPFWGFIAFVVVAGLLGVAWYVPVIPLDRDELTVSFSQGEAIIKSADGSAAELVTGAGLKAGDRLLVSDGASVTLSSPDGHALTVSDRAEIQTTRGRKTLLGGRTKSRVDVEEGVTRISGTGEPRASLEIGLPNGVAGVRGTIFEVNIDQSRSAISVHQGAVGLSDNPGRPVDVHAGKGAILNAEQTELRELPWAPEEIEIKSTDVIRTPDTLISWLPVDGAAGYVVEFSTDPDFLEVVSHLRAGPEDRRLAIPIVEVDKTVHARVYAVTETGLAGPPSPTETLEISAHWAKGLDLIRQSSLEESPDQSQPADQPGAEPPPDALSVPEVGGEETPGPQDSETPETGDSLDDAMAELQIALERFPDNPQLLKDVGWIHYLAGRYEEAREVYERGRSIDPDYTDLLFQLGRTYFWLEEYERSEDAFRTILSLNPDHAHALWGIGDTYRVLGRRQEALEYVERALALQPDHPYALDTLEQLRKGG